MIIDLRNKFSYGNGLIGDVRTTMPFDRLIKKTSYKALQEGKIPFNAVSFNPFIRTFIKLISGVEVS